jgi:hypothetical protein
LLLGSILVTAAACERPAPPDEAAASGAPSLAARALWDGRDRRLALVIGHDRGSASRKPLRYAQTDATRLAVVLRDLGGFLGSDIHLLEGPTLSEVRAALGALAAQVRAFRGDARTRGVPGRATLLVYFSGHSDGKVLELGGEGLSFADLRHAVDAIGADLRLVILDACRSGSLLALKGPGGVSAAADFDLSQPLESSTGEVLITSSSASEDALESEELRASFFSHYLLSGLRGAADVNHDGRVTLSEAFQHAAGRTTSETAGTILGSQHPSYQNQLTGRGDLVLTQIPRTRAAIEMAAAVDRALLMDALTGGVAAEWTPGGGDRLAVTPGPYVVHAWKDGHRSTARFTLPPGTTRRVTDQLLLPVENEASEAGSRASEIRLRATARPPGVPAALAPRASETALRQSFASAATCAQRCLIDLRSNRHDCNSGAITVLTAATGQMTLALDVPAQQHLVRLRFEVCDPDGLWLDVGDSPGCDGGGGDDGQFSHDAELELRNTGLYLHGDDYGRDHSNSITTVASRPDFVATRGCTQRTLVLGDQLLRSQQPPLQSTSPFALRLDPPEDHEGRPDRRWYLGLNRSVASDVPSRAGRGLGWVEICVR